MNSPGRRMMETKGVSASSDLYSGIEGKCVSSMAILVSSDAATTCAGPRPRLVAITVNPFSMLREGTIVISTHGRSALIMACACSKAASALLHAASALLAAISAADSEYLLWRSIFLSV